MYARGGRWRRRRAMRRESPARIAAGSAPPLAQPQPFLCVGVEESPASGPGVPASGGGAWQEPERQTPFEQRVRSGAVGWEHLPVAGSHWPAGWHSSVAAGQVTTSPPTQTPLWQTSRRLQRSWSSQETWESGVQWPSRSAPVASAHVRQDPSQAASQHTRPTQNPLPHSPLSWQALPTAEADR